MTSLRRFRGFPVPLTPHDRAQDLTRLLDQQQPDELWVFAYGSLIWNPCFSYDAVHTATLDGYRRAFNFWSVISRGTPEQPGLGLGLEAGGRCRGVVYRIGANTLAQDLEALWQREMHSDVYQSRWLTLDTPAGEITAIGFTTNTTHGQYAGGLTNAETASIIANACGENGPCRDYLASTVAALARHGIGDDTLSTLLALVDDVKPA